MNALTNPCPWIITAHPGQQINISIVNFNSTQKAPYNSYGYLGSGRGPCVDVAKVTDGGAQDAIQLCRHQKREVTAYVSRSHDITLHLPTTPADHGGGIFLLKFKGRARQNVLPYIYTPALGSIGSTRLALLVSTLMSAILRHSRPK